MTDSTEKAEKLAAAKKRKLLSYFILTNQVEELKAKKGKKNKNKNKNANANANANSKEKETEKEKEKENVAQDSNSSENNNSSENEKSTPCNDLKGENSVKEEIKDLKIIDNDSSKENIKREDKSSDKKKDIKNDDKSEIKIERKDQSSDSKNKINEKQNQSSELESLKPVSKDENSKEKSASELSTTDELKQHDNKYNNDEKNYKTVKDASETPKSTKLVKLDEKNDEPKLESNSDNTQSVPISETKKDENEKPLKQDNSKESSIDASISTSSTQDLNPTDTKQSTNINEPKLSKELEKKHDDSDTDKLLQENTTLKNKVKELEFTIENQAAEIEQLTSRLDFLSQDAMENDNFSTSNSINFPSSNSNIANSERSKVSFSANPLEKLSMQNLSKDDLIDEIRSDQADVSDRSEFGNTSTVENDNLQRHIGRLESALLKTHKDKKELQEEVLKLRSEIHQYQKDLARNAGNGSTETHKYSSLIPPIPGLNVNDPYSNSPGDRNEIGSIHESDLELSDSDNDTTTVGAKLKKMSDRKVSGHNSRGKSFHDINLFGTKNISPILINVTAESEKARLDEIKESINGWRSYDFDMSNFRFTGGEGPIFSI